MKAFVVHTTSINSPHLVIAEDIKNVFRIMEKQKSSSITSIKQLESFGSHNILLEEILSAKDSLEREVRREIQESMPMWRREPFGAAGGGEEEVFLIRTSRGHYFTSSCVGGDNYYLMLDSLEQLPGLPKED